MHLKFYLNLLLNNNFYLSRFKHFRSLLFYAIELYCQAHFKFMFGNINRNKIEFYKLIESKRILIKIDKLLKLVRYLKG